MNTLPCMASFANEEVVQTKLEKEFSLNFNMRNFSLINFLSEYKTSICRLVVIAGSIILIAMGIPQLGLLFLSVLSLEAFFFRGKDLTKQNFQKQNHEVVEISKNLNSDFIVQGHRGSRGTYPENTLSAFMEAIKVGAKAIELDIVLSKDKELVINHDLYITKNSFQYLDGSAISKSILISSMLLSEIKKIDCGSKQNKDYPNQKIIPKTLIPTLQELFDMVINSKHLNAQTIHFNLEMKYDVNSNINKKEFAEIIVNLVKINSLAGRCHYSSFDIEMLREVRAIYAEAKLGFIFNGWTISNLIGGRNFDGWALSNLWNCFFHPNWCDFVIKTCSDLKVDVISPDYALLDSKKVQEIKRSSLRIIPWTVNNINDCQKLIGFGVEGIITDYPEKFIKHFLKI